MSKMRIGIIGCGGMARSHVSRFEKVLDRIEVTAVVDIERDKAQAVAALLAGDPIVETEYHKVLDHLDAALLYCHTICTTLPLSIACALENPFSAKSRWPIASGNAWR